MSHRKHVRAGIAAVAVVIAAAIAVPALAASPPAKVTQTMVGGPQFVPNRLIGDTMHFKLGKIAIKKGGTITLVDKTKAPHSFSLVKKSDVPRTASGVDACFEKGVCGKLAVAHGFIDPNTGEERDEPTTLRVDVGKPGFDQPGDSVIIPPGGKTKVKITSDQPLYFICGFHPWMQGTVNGKSLR